MARWPTRSDENQIRRPREGGDPFPVDSRLRGNDAHGRIFRVLRITPAACPRVQYRPPPAHNTLHAFGRASRPRGRARLGLSRQPLVGLPELGILRIEGIGDAVFPQCFFAITLLFQPIG